jgi:Uma2 family endonuclease
MGTLYETGIAREALIARWKEILADPELAKLPYQIEMNQWGRIEMAPFASPRHMNTGGLLAKVLREQLGGSAFQECAILTPIGVRGADVVWCSPEFVARHAAVFKSGEPLLQEAPELCVEVKSPSNNLGELKQKVDAYLACGAHEAWIVMEDLTVRCFGPEGEREQSQFKLDLDPWRAEAR